MLIFQSPSLANCSISDMINVAIVVVAIDGGSATGEARISSRDTGGLTRAAISSRFVASSTRIADGGSSV